MVVAVRQALDYQSTGRAIGVCVIGWVAQVIVVAILMVALGDHEDAAPFSMIILSTLVPLVSFQAKQLFEPIGCPA